MKNRLLSFAIALFMACTLLPFSAFALENTTISKQPASQTSYAGNIVGLNAVLGNGTCGENLTWTLDSEGTLIVSGNGEMTSAPWNSDYSDSIINVVINEGVTNIADSAFIYCRNLKTAVLPEGLTSIGTSSFARCTALESVNLPSTLTEICSDAFFGCYSLTDVKLPANLTSIASNSFDSCYSLTSVEYPGTVDYYSQWPYPNCYGITDITYGEGTKTIRLPNDEYPCLTRVTFPSTVINIHNYLSRCENLKDIYYNGTAAQWKNVSASELKSNLGSAKVHCLVASGNCGNNADWALYDDYHLVISGSGEITSTPWNEYAGSSIGIVEIEKGITNIEKYAFANNCNMGSIEIPEGVTIIESNAFDNSKCEYPSILHSVSIPASVKQIQSSAFNGCSQLKDIYYSGSQDDWNAIAIGSYNTALNNATVHYVVDNENTGRCGDGAFWMYNDGVLTISGTGNMWDYSDKSSLSYQLKEEVKKIVIEDGIETLGKYVFNGFANVKEVEIGVSLRTVSEGAFYNCSSITDVYYHDTQENWKRIKRQFNNDCLYKINIHYIASDSGVCGKNVTWTLDENGTLTISGTGPMYNYSSVCDNLAPWYYRQINAIVIENGVTYVGESSLKGSNLGSLTIPKTVTALGDHVFRFCYDLNSVYFEGNAPVLGDDVFPSYPTTPTIYAPLGNSTWTYSSHYDAAAQTFDGCSIEFICYHDYAAVITEPTCTEDGYTTYTCKICDNSYTDGVVPATGHEFGDWKVTTPPTCTEKGEETRYCSRCDATETREIAENGHYYDEVVTKPTCTAGGYTTYACSVCDYSYTDSVKPARGHNFGDWKVTTLPTCTEKGEETRYCSRCDATETREVKTLGHNLVHHESLDATCTENGWEAYETCSRCDYTTYKEIHANGHDYETIVTAPTCTDEGYTTHTCSVCNYSYKDSVVPALDHNFGEWEVTAEPTCTEKGEETRYCLGCNATETHAISANGHDYETIVTAPTCTDEGYTTHTCSVCNYSYKDSVVPALDHNFGEWEVTAEPTCTEKGEETHCCSRCNATETREISANGHDYETIVTAPTCTDGGYTTHICLVCDYSYTDNVVPALDHNFGGWKVTAAATCTEKGEETRKCFRCDTTEIREIAASGHDYKALVTAPTCTEDGYTTYVCSKCGDSYKSDITDAPGHKTTLVNAKTATCTATGYTGDKMCSVCGEIVVKGEVIPTRAHYEINGKCKYCGRDIFNVAVGGSRTLTLTSRDNLGRLTWHVDDSSICRVTYNGSGLSISDEVKYTFNSTVEGYKAGSTSIYAYNDNGKKLYTAVVVVMDASEWCITYGHSFGEWTLTKAATCTDNGIETCYCSNCGAAEIREISAAGHNYKAKITAPTCTNGGYTTHTCSVCNYSYKDSVVPALGHNFGDWKVTTDPTCTEKGVETRFCSRCGAAENHEIAALEHDFDTVVTKPTCTKDGYTTCICSICGYSHKDNYVDALGHKTEVKNAKAATCTTAGYTGDKVCTVCSTVVEQGKTIAALGHNYADGVCTVCGAKDPNYKPPVKKNPFVDVKEGSVYYDAILWAYYHEPQQITGGFDATHFVPGNPCTRAQVVTFLWRAAGCPEPAGDTSIFKDAESIAAPFQKAVAWAVEKGITAGFNDGTFRPNDPVTRAQFVTFLWRYEGQPSTTGSINGFADAASIATPYQSAVAWAVEKGITTGYNDNTFRPNDVCTRWAVVLFMYRDMA